VEETRGWRERGQRSRCQSEDIRSEDETRLTRQHAKYWMDFYGNVTEEREREEESEREGA